MDKTLILVKIFGIEQDIQRVYDNNLNLLSQKDKELLSKAVESLFTIRREVVKHFER